MTNKTKEILIVEDEHDISALLKEFFEENGFGVTLANDGRTAIELLGRIEFDLLIIDMLLPGEHGLDIIKMKGGHHLTPVIIISGIYTEQDILDLKKNPNIKYFVKKPFDMKDLLEKVEAALNADPL